ncbi:hypothetical protein ACSSS7_000438 [Eimeria intestinalis]
MAVSPSSSLLLLRKEMPVKQQHEDLLDPRLGGGDLLEGDSYTPPPPASALLETESQLALHPIDRSFILYMCLGFVMCMLVLLLFVTLMCVLGER